MDVAHSDTYEELDLEAAVEQAKSSQGISYVLTDRQKGAIYSVLKGNDTFVNLPTGYGKSMVYQLVPQCVEFMKLKQVSLLLSFEPLTRAQFEFYVT